ncbi:MAG: acyl-CoA synthetase [Sphingomonadales bacterium]|nr:acyl-CoA synthetase [Sphingomonadales bacterium]MBD3772691.1 acyl-CoA synthetase [Paracoccaceae bacterium]
MHPRNQLAERADKPAVIMAGSGAQLTYAELEAAANRGAHLLRQCGLQRGDAIAMMVENSLEFFTTFWAAQRAGVFITPLAIHLTAPEASYIIGNCGAKLAVLSAGIGETTRRLVEERASLMPGVTHIFGHRGLAGVPDWTQACAALPDTPIADESQGYQLLYSSGTTGQPKGVRVELPDTPLEEGTTLSASVAMVWQMGPHTTYLSPAPMYHAAPLNFSTAVQRMGGTVVVMEKFDPHGFLAAIERHRVNMTQVVPTMFIRLLRLSEEERGARDLSSLRLVLHAAAPCPIAVKRAMIEWLGPVVYEYYAGSEGNGSTAITPQDWLEHPGSVGRPPIGGVHICGDDGAELPPGEVGAIYFSGGKQFEYLGDADKTAGSRNPLHPEWSTLGDVGWKDEDGFLYLADRKDFMIITGGVNVYPQEVEHHLVMHPKVADAAVFGLPDADFGEQVTAVIQPLDPLESGDALADELDAWCRTSLSRVKCPRAFHFSDALPRQENGKLYKKKLREEFLAATGQTA